MHSKVANLGSMFANVICLTTPHILCGSGAWLTNSSLRCRDSKAPFTFVVQLMVPGPPFLSLTMAWAADYDPSKRPATDSPHSPDGSRSSFAAHDYDSDSELIKSSFDLCLARLVVG